MFRNRIFFISALIALLDARPAAAQLAIGLEAGVSKNYLVTNVSNLNATLYNPVYGFTIGVPVVYSINSWLAIEADPAYLQKNNELDRTGFYSGVFERRFNGYAQLPVLARFFFGGRKLKGFLHLGGYGAYWISGRIQGAEPNILNQPAYTGNFSNTPASNVYDYYTPYQYDTKYSFNNSRDNRLEWGLAAGAGLSYEWTKTYQFFLETRYTESLTDQQKKYQLELVPRYNETVTLALGCLYRLK